MKKKKKKVVLNYLEKFIFSLVLIIFTSTAVLSLTILNKQYVSSKFTEEHYQEVEKSLKQEMKQSMISSGLDDDIITDMFTSGDIKNTTEQVLDIIYDNSHKDLDTSIIEKKLRYNIDKNLEKKGFSASDKEGYNEFVKATMDIYRGEFIMLNQLPQVSKVVQLLDKCIISLAILFGIIAFSWILIRRKKLYKFLPAALFTTSFLTLFLCFYINKEAGLSSITIVSVTFSKILRKIIMSTFNTYMVIAVVYIILGIMILLLKKYHRHHRHHHHSHE